MATITRKQIDEARDELRKILKPGDTVYTRMQHCSKSGMMRVIDLFIIRDNEPRRITWQACKATNTAYNEKHEGMRMDGCGMDMGFAAVYNLGRALFPAGFAPSNNAIRPVDGKSVDVSAFRGKDAGPLTKPEIEALTQKGWKFTRGLNGDTSGWDEDGGYALNHRWL